MARFPHILLIYTGGTIGMVKDFQTGALKTFNFDKLIKHIPEINHLNCTIDSFSFKNPIDSSNMNPTEWVFLAEVIEDRYDDFDGFVVLHGSDTMSYTASAISFMFENLTKPIIFTGSQLPIGDLRTDAKENLITSIEIASCVKNDKPVISEVCLYFEYKLYRANRTTKINSEQFEAFASPNYPPLAESGVHLKFNTPLIYKPLNTNPLLIHKKFNNNIALLKLFPGITKNVVESILNIPENKGIIMETYGSGNALTEPWFLEALRRTIAKGIPVINVTQCTGGSVIMGVYETSVDIQNIGIISGNDITTESALAKLMFLLGEKKKMEEIKKQFEISIRGEVSEAQIY